MLIDHGIFDKMMSKLLEIHCNNVKVVTPAIKILLRLVQSDASASASGTTGGTGSCVLAARSRIPLSLLAVLGKYQHRDIDDVAVNICCILTLLMPHGCQPSLVDAGLVPLLLTLLRQHRASLSNTTFIAHDKVVSLICGVITVVATSLRVASVDGATNSPVHDVGMFRAADVVATLTDVLSASSNDQTIAHAACAALGAVAEFLMPLTARHGAAVEPSVIDAALAAVRSVPAHPPVDAEFITRVIAALERSSNH
jgi:hypothetical protein